MKDANEVLQQKEAELAHVRCKIEGLQIVAPLLSDELPSASSAEEILDRGPGSEATGTHGQFSSVISNPRTTFWKILKRNPPKGVT
jgi:hypothetical protein